jgi:translation initiation factor IF-2
MHVLKDPKKAQEIAESRKVKRERSLVPSTGQRAMTLEDLARALSEADQLELKLIIKADVQGSVEAVSEALTRLSTDKVKVIIVHAAAGAITEGDVNLGVAAGAIIIGFNVRPDRNAADVAEREKVDIRQHSVIYHVTDEIKKAMTGLLEPTFKEQRIGIAQVRETFKVPKIGTIAGCMVTDGRITRQGDAQARLLRDNVVVWEGKLASLKRFKDDVSEVKSGFECGLGLQNFNDVKVGDVIEVFQMERVAQPA